MPKARKPKVKYRTCIVSFFDILGFREIVKRKRPAEIVPLVSLFQETGQIRSSTASTFEAQSFQFSDSIVRMMPIDSKTNTKYPVGLLFHEILTIVHAELEMANRGVFLRGGITIGNAYFSGSTMFGPAMVRAYDLESRVAIYPRIVVDPKLIESLKTDPRMKKDSHEVADEIGHVRTFLRRDHDGVWFVDFLRAALNEVDDPILYSRLLDEHRKAVEGILRKRTLLDDVTVKLLWSAHYHNRVIDDLIGEGQDPDDVQEHRITIPPHLLGPLPSQRPER